MDADAAARLLDKMRRFVATELDDDERALFAALVAPGVAKAYPVEDDVEAYGIVGWSPSDLPDALVAELRRGGIRVEGLGL